jgi:hypothetical protein
MMLPTPAKTDFDELPVSKRHRQPHAKMSSTRFPRTVDANLSEVATGGLRALAACLSASSQSWD